MINNTSKYIEKIARLVDTDNDFDRVLALYTAKIIAPKVSGKKVIEAGCSTGVITPFLIKSAKSLDVVEGSSLYYKKVKAKYGEKIKIHNELFEKFSPEEKFDAVVLTSVLHHFEKPRFMLRHISSWLKPKGEIHITVPNMESFHRQLGVAMDMSKSVFDPSERNKKFNQPGRFTAKKLMKTVEGAGFKTEECFGFFFKPFPHAEMQKLNLSSKILDGLFEMGKKYPDMACQIYIRVKKK